MIELGNPKKCKGSHAGFSVLVHVHVHGMYSLLTSKCIGAPEDGCGEPAHTFDCPALTGGKHSVSKKSNDAKRGLGVNVT